MTSHCCGLYRAIVVDNADPEGLSRLRVNVPQVLGAATSAWAWPCQPSAVLDAYSPPDVGQGVWVMFESGDINHPVWMGVWR